MFMMEEVEEVLQNSYAMKKLDFQRDVLECRDLFAQFSKQLQDACLTFEMEIKGGKLPQPNILWFSYGFQNNIASKQPALEQNAGRLCSSELTNTEEDGKGKDQKREAAGDVVVKDFPHLSFQNDSTLYLEESDARSNSLISTDNNGTDYDADVSCVSGNQSGFSAFYVAESDTTVNVQSTFQTTYCDSSSYVIHSLSRQLHGGSRYQEPASECCLSDSEMIAELPIQGMSYEKASFPSVSILAQVDDLLSCYETAKSVELDHIESKNVVRNIYPSRSGDKEPDSPQMSMDSIVRSNSMQLTALGKINGESPWLESVSINSMSLMNGALENVEKLAYANSDMPVAKIADELIVAKCTDSHEDSIFSINQRRNETLKNTKAQKVVFRTPYRPAAARPVSSKPDSSLRGGPAEVCKNATDGLFQDKSCEHVVKRKRRRGKPPLNMPRNKKTRRGNDFMKVYVNRPNVQSYLDASYTRQEPMSANIKRVRDKIDALSSCSQKEFVIRNEMSAKARSPLFSSREGMVTGDKVIKMNEGTHDDIPNGFLVFDNASHPSAPSVVPQTGKKDTITSLDDVLENGRSVDGVVITNASTNNKSDVSKSNADEASQSLEKTANLRKKAIEHSCRVIDHQGNTVFGDLLSVKGRLRARQLVPILHRKDKKGNSALHAATGIFKGEGGSSAKRKLISRRNMKKKRGNMSSNSAAIKHSQKISNRSHSESPKEGLDLYSLIQPPDALLKQAVEMEIDTNDHLCLMLKENVQTEESCNSKQPIANSCPDVKTREDKARGVPKGEDLEVHAIRSTKRGQKEGRAAKRWSHRISERNNSKEFKEPENSASASVSTNKDKLGEGNQNGKSGKGLGKKQDRCTREKRNKDHIHNSDSSVMTLQKTKSKNRFCAKGNQFEAGKTKKRRKITLRVSTSDNDVDMCNVGAATADSLNLAGCYAMKEDTAAVDAENITISVNSSCTLHLSDNAESKDITEKCESPKLGEIPCKNYREHNKDYSMLRNKSSKVGKDLVCEVNRCVSPIVVASNKSGYGSENRVMTVNSSVHGVEDEPETERSVINRQRRRTASVAPKLIFIEENDEAILKRCCLKTEKETKAISVNPVAVVAGKRGRKWRNNTNRAAEAAKRVSQKRGGPAKDADRSKEQTLVFQQRSIHHIKTVDRSSKEDEKSEVELQGREKDSATDFSDVTRDENKSANNTGSTKVCNSKVSEGDVFSAKNKNRRKRSKDDITSVTTLQKPHSYDLSATVSSASSKKSSSSLLTKVEQPVPLTNESSRISGRSSSKGNRITQGSCETTFKSPETRQRALKTKNAKKRGSSNSTDATVLLDKRKRTLFCKKTSSTMSLGFSMVQDSVVNVTRESVMRSNTSVMPQTLSNFLQSFVAPKVKKRSK